MDSVGTHHELEAVGVRRRAVAYLVDLLLVGGSVLVVVNRSERSLEERALAFTFHGTVVGLLYHVAFEGGFGGTVGKAAVGIVVVEDDGTRCTYRAAAIRTALRSVD
jgi:uncharacterized RDD family membrane protein YckC